MPHLRPLAVIAALSVISALPAHAAAPTPVTSADRAFVAGASSSNAAEIAAGHIALRKGDSASKAFATKMIADHTAMQQSLKRVASRLQLLVRTRPSTTQTHAINTMARLSGAAFDKAYRANQIKAHQATITLFQKEIKAGSTPKLKNAARTNFAQIKMHYAMAQKLPATGSS
jgi:putative membrane protein